MRWYLLSNYGDVTTVTGAQNAFQQAKHEASISVRVTGPEGSYQMTGGTIEIPPNTNPNFEVPPISDPYIVVIDRRNGIIRLQLPPKGEIISHSASYPLAGRMVRRTLQMGPKQQSQIGDCWSLCTSCGSST
jgi:hypothetical protein